MVRGLDSYNAAGDHLRETHQIGDVNGDGAQDELHIYATPRSFVLSLDDLSTIPYAQVPPLRWDSVIRFGDPENAGKLLSGTPQSFVRKSDGHRFNIGDTVVYKGRSYAITFFGASHREGKTTAYASIKAAGVDGLVDGVDINNLELPQE